MPCNLHVLGFDGDSQQQACAKFLGDPGNYYLSCNFTDNTNLVISCSVYDDPSCTSLTTSGWFSNGQIYRYFDVAQGTLSEASTCAVSRFVKYCCDSLNIRYYDVSNLLTLLGSNAIVGTIWDLELLDSNNHIFRGCFEIINDIVTAPQATIVNHYNEYVDCVTCQISLQQNGTKCYYNSGATTFISCTNPNDVVLLNVTTPNVIQYGETVYFSGKCYYGQTVPVPPIILSGSVSTSLQNGCNNILCLPTPTPVPVKTSKYVSGCCDNKVYELKSGNLYNVGTYISVLPNRLCYKVIEKTINIPIFGILNDTNGVSSNLNSCQDSKCEPCPPFPPPTPPPYPVVPGLSVNECDVITILPIGIECVSINPSLANGYSGILSVNITGGTAPYTVVWTSPGGQTFTGTTIFNKPAGTYLVHVYDKWGDVDATSSCVLEEPVECFFTATINEFNTPTPLPTSTGQPTPTLTPTPTCYSAGCCDCPQGFTWVPLNNGSGNCYRLDEYSAIAPNPSISVILTGNSVYSVSGTRFYGTSFNSNGTGTIVHTSFTNDLWFNNVLDSVTGPMNRSSVWTTLRNGSDWLPLNTWIGFSTCISGTTSKTYYLGVGGNDNFKVIIDNTEIINTRTTTTSASTDNFNYWNVYPITIPNGNHVVQVLGLNNGSFAGVGCEIYDNTLSQLTAATSISQLNVIYSTSGETSLEVVQDIGGSLLSSGYTCPSGYVYSECSNSCVQYVVCTPGPTPGPTATPGPTPGPSSTSTPTPTPTPTSTPTPTPTSTPPPFTFYEINASLDGVLYYSLLNGAQSYTVVNGSQPLNSNDTVEGYHNNTVTSISVRVQRPSLGGYLYLTKNFTFVQCIPITTAGISNVTFGPVSFTPSDVITITLYDGVCI